MNFVLGVGTALTAPAPREAKVTARAFSPLPGHEWNPLRRYRNLPCPCGSNRKAKRCHGQAEALPSDQIAQIKGYLRALSAQGFIEARKGEIS